MNEIQSINSKAVRQILDAYGLGQATLLEDGHQMRIFLEHEASTVMACDLATRDLEASTCRVVDIALKSAISPAQQEKLVRFGCPV